MSEIISNINKILINILCEFTEREIKTGQNNFNIIKWN